MSERVAAESAAPASKCDTQQIVDDDDENVCCICNASEGLSQTRCGHDVHVECMLQYSKHQNDKNAATNCPICRKEMLAAPAEAGVPLLNITTRFIHTGHHPGRQHQRRQQGNVLGPLLNQQVSEELDNMVNMIIQNAHQEHPSETMFNAVCDGNIQQVEQLTIQFPHLVNRKRDDDSTILHHAIYRRHVEVVNFLLSNRANPRVPDRYGCTPLHAAVTVGSADIARRLLGYNACVEARDNNGETPLFYAVRGKNVAMVSLLIRKHADVNATNVMGNTCLHLLAQGNFPHNITTLFKQSRPSCLNHKNYIGDSTMHIAVENCNLGFLRKFKTMFAFHSRFEANHIGMTPEDYIVLNDERYEGINLLFTHWRRNLEDSSDEHDPDAVTAPEGRTPRVELQRREESTIRDLAAPAQSATV